MARNKILIVDDEAGLRFGVRDYLELQGYEVDEAESCRTAQDRFRAARPDVVVADYLLADGTALDLLPRLKEIDAEIPLLILTAHGSIDLAVRAIKEGAEQFLTKPLELPALLVILQRILENKRNLHKQRANKTREARTAIDPFFGTSPAILGLAEQARKILLTESPILILGETGTGKGVLSRWLHANSPRSEEAFVDLNCAGLSRELLETELFGHEKGAFTSATSSKQGLFEVAHRGTIFLDEIGDVDLQIQPKLLKVLEDKRFRRVGDVRDRQVDVRFRATHQDTSTGRKLCLRRSLWNRLFDLSCVEERKNIQPAQYLLGLVDLGRGRCNSVRLSRALQSYSCRERQELRNVIERPHAQRSETIGLKDLHFDGRTAQVYTNSNHID